MADHSAAHPRLGLYQLAFGYTMCIGVDGGATKVRAVVAEKTAGGRLRVVARSRRLPYPRVPGFRPLPLPRQLDDLAEGRLRLTDDERLMAEGAVRTVARAIAEVTQRAGGVRVGLCLAGLKTAEGAGVAVCANGPRMPDFVEKLREELARIGRAGLRIVLPLGSDGYCCGLGEDAWPTGRLRAVRIAYYAGAGTGLAEAVKLDGRVVSMDHVSSWFPKAWQVHMASGQTADELLSARGLLGLRAATCKGGQTHEERPLRAAARGEPWAEEALRLWANAWAAFIFERLRMWHKARPQCPLQRVVIGQRAGVAFSTPTLVHLFRSPLTRTLTRTLRRAPHLRALYLREDRLVRGFLVSSPWMEAPAVGAAVLAMEAGNG